MKRIWISRQSAIPVREQLSAQLLYAILGRRLKPGERLPSVRDLARRLKLHANTVSAAYRDLAARGWVKRKAGSGVFVCDIAHRGKGEGIDAFVQAWMEEAQQRGFSMDALRDAFDKARGELESRDAQRRLLVVHSDGNLAHILAAEIEEAVRSPVSYAAIDDARSLPDFESFVVLTTTSAAETVAQLQPKAQQLIPLKSVDELIAGLGRPEAPVLIAMVSSSESILKWASMLIPALGIAGSDVIQRNPEQARWMDGIAACDIIAADVLAARELPKNMRPILLRLVPESFLEEARRLVTAKKV